MKSKAQASLEYLMTYGWALIIIATVVAVLVFVAGTPSEEVKFSSRDPTKLLVKGGVVSGNDVGLVLINLTGGNIDVNNVGFETGYANCTLNGENIPLASPLSITAGGNLTIECSKARATGESYGAGDIKVQYTDQLGLNRTTEITASGESTVYFEKTDYESEKDCITPNVCITRNEYEGLYNAVLDDDFWNNQDGPSDTQWFNGNCGSSPEALSYTTWSNVVGRFPPFELDTPFCVHLITDNLYYEIVVYKWTIGFWGGGPGGGGFAYYRKKIK